MEANQKAGDAWNTVDAGSGLNSMFAVSSITSRATSGEENKPSIKWLIDAQCDTHWTPIMFAARYGHLPIVKYLASLGARLENMTTYGPLHAACFGLSIAVVRNLINEWRVDVNP